jgi:hypothetical protein
MRTEALDAMINVAEKSLIFLSEKKPDAQQSEK